MSDLEAAKDRDVKGILIVNAFNELPADKRTEPPFPNDVLQFAETRKFALMTGVQILGIHCASLKNPAERIALVDKIFATDGWFPDFRDFGDYGTIIKAQ